MAAQLTVTEIQERIASEVDQSVTTVTVGGAEWLYRLKLINRAQDEWSMAHDWDSLYKVHIPTVSGVSQGSISLPADFKSLADAPRIFSTGISTGENWPIIKTNQVNSRLSTEKYAYLIGNPMAGYTLRWNPGTLASGATLNIPYHAIATSLASPADITEVEEGEFLVKRVSSWLLRTRNDARFQDLGFEAREILRLAIENDNTQDDPTTDNVETPEKLVYSFRLGRD